MAKSLSDSLRDLSAAKGRLAGTSLSGRMGLLRGCLQGVVEVARDWVDGSCEFKGIPPGSPLRSEEVATGPVASARFLQLLIRSLEQIERFGKPQLPGQPRRAPDGVLEVPVLPDRGIFDPILFMGFRGFVRMEKEVSANNFDSHLAPQYRGTKSQTPRVALVLGAGNVSAIPVTDTLSKIFLENSVVLLKMNPVNETLGPFFEKALQPLVEAGFLRIVYGGKEVGQEAVAHSEVGTVHITGSDKTHDSIVWGPPGVEREARIAANKPCLEKPITSELGNVTPWILVPGPYKTGEIRAQAETLVGSLTNNAGFNCLSTKVVITWKKWDRRREFIDTLEGMLAAIPPRKAYYPGAIERFARFTGQTPESSWEERLPWTFLRDADPKAHYGFLQEEWFGCLSMEVCLDAEDEADFLRKAVDFANEKCWGTLAANLTVHPRTLTDRRMGAVVWESVGRLRYGTVAINQWAGLAYFLMSLPWGGYPGQPLADIQSGAGWVHNTWMLDSIEKGVLVGPLRVFPKPLWSPTHPNPEPITWRLLDLFADPSYGAVAKVALSSMRGLWG